MKNNLIVGSACNITFNTDGAVPSNNRPFQGGTFYHQLNDSGGHIESGPARISPVRQIEKNTLGYEDYWNIAAGVTPKEQHNISVIPDTKQNITPEKLFKNNIKSKVSSFSLSKNAKEFVPFVAQTEASESDFTFRSEQDLIPLQKDLKFEDLHLLTNDGFKDVLPPLQLVRTDSFKDVLPPLQMVRTDSFKDVLPPCQMVRTDSFKDNFSMSSMSTGLDPLKVSPEIKFLKVSPGLGPTAVLTPPALGGWPSPWCPNNPSNLWLPIGPLHSGASSVTGGNR
eukprot:UN33806